MAIKQNEKFTRQPALRLFAAELAESKQTVTEHVEGRDYDSRYQLTPSGVKVKRVFMIGVLVEVDNVEPSGGYLRGRIIDPTGAFTVYAGQYQPDALRALSGFTIPCFVAVVGKTSAYRPDEKTTIVSIRPETIVEIDAKTRDYWIKETVSRTIERVERSQLPETEKEKYRQICRNALTKLIDLPKEISKYLPEIPKEPIETTASAGQTVPTEPHQGDIPASPLIEQSIRKDAAREIPGIKEEMAIEAIKRLMDEGRCNEPIVGFLHPVMNEEEPLAASSSTSEIDTEPDSENLNPQEIKEHKTRLNNPVKSRKRKKKTEEKVMRKTQKALFPSE